VVVCALGELETGEWTAMRADARRGSAVGALSANDIDLDARLTYSIVSGNHDNAFVIDRRCGLLSVNNRLDFERTATYRLSVQVTGSRDFSARTTLPSET